MAALRTRGDGRGASLYQGVEEPDSFILIVEWDPVEAHTDLTRKPWREGGLTCPRR